MSRRGARLSTVNVASVEASGSRLWQFPVRGAGVGAAVLHPVSAGAVLPQRAAGKDWSQLVQPRLNVGWLAGDDVFLRVLQLPRGEPDELLPMVELQLEQVSPIPVAHVAWTVEVVPHPDPALQTAVVVMAPRSAVEARVAELEAAGFRPDRLEVPLVRRWLRGDAADGLDVRVEAGSDVTRVLVAWRLGGILREAALLPLGGPEGDRVSALVSHLTAAARAAELDGWLTELPSVRVEAPAGEVAPWENALREWSGRTVTCVEPPDDQAVAGWTATAQLGRPSDPLLPAEVAVRYQQDFVDRLWTRGLGGVGLVYLVGVLFFLAALNWRRMNHEDLEAEVRSMGGIYTNVLTLRAQVDVLEEQVGLKYAALDSWRAAIEKLPASLTLQSLSFRNGRTLTLQGSAPAEAQADVTAFNAELQRVQVRGTPLFGAVTPAAFNLRGNVGTWSFDAELATGRDTP